MQHVPDMVIKLFDFFGAPARKIAPLRQHSKPRLLPLADNRCKCVFYRWTNFGLLYLIRSFLVTCRF